MNESILRLLMTQTWQITALALVVAVVVKLGAKNRPHLAHALWVLVLIKCVTPPLWGHSLGVFSQLQAQLMPDESAFLPDATNLPPSVSVAIAETLDQAPQIDVPDTEHGQLETYESDELLSLASAKPPEDATLMSNGGSGLELDETVQTLDKQEANIAYAEPVLSAERVETDASWLGPGWLLPGGLAAGAMMTLFIMVIRCLRCLREIHRHRTTEFDAQLCERVQHLSKQLRIRRIPQIIVSDVLFGPAVLGLLRHTIVLPRCLFLSMKAESGERKAESRDAEQHATTACKSPLSAVGFPLSFLDPILAHELLHIRRGDLRTGTLQAIVQSLWWFHPAVWLSNRWLSREAERCCDEQVIAELGCTPSQYARSLLSVIECKHQLQPIPVFPGMKPVEITSQRMERIMSLKNGLKKRTPLWCWLTVAAMAFVVLPGAVATPTLVAEPKPSTSISNEDTVVATATDRQTVDEKALATNTKQAGDSAEAIRLNKDFVLSTDVKPHTVIAFVNEKPVRVEDVIPTPVMPAEWVPRVVNVPRIDVRSALRDRLPKFLYEELLVQHFYAFVPAERRAIALESLKQPFDEVLEKIKDNYQLETDDQLAAWLAVQNTTVDKLQQGFVRMQIVSGYQHSLPTDSPLRCRETIIEKCKSLLDDWKEVSIPEPFPEPLLKLVKDESAALEVPARPVSAAITEASDPLVKLVWDARESTRKRLLSTDQHTPWQLMHGLLGLRQDFVVSHNGRIINGLEWIQSGPTFKDAPPFQEDQPWFQKTKHGGRAHPYLRPYLFEGHINQFAAILASCRLPLNAQFGTPDGPITMQDLITNAQMTANDTEEVSWTLSILSRYLPPDARWVNAKDEAWSIERLVKVEVGKTIGGSNSPCGGTCGLLALAVARNEYLRSGKPLDGVWLEADHKIQKCIELAKTQQHADGTLSSNYFKGGEAQKDFDQRVASSGALLQFLMMATSDQQLKEDWLRRAVEATVNDLVTNRKKYISAGPLFETTNALSIYLDRVAVCEVTDVQPESSEVPVAERLVLCSYPVADLVVYRQAMIAADSQSAENSDTAQTVPPAALALVHEKPAVEPQPRPAKESQQMQVVKTYHADFAPLTELIKATVQPESWASPGKAIISIDKGSLSLVIRQTQAAHEEIAELLPQLRNAQDQTVSIHCRILKLTSEEDSKWLEELVSLHELQGRTRWALLSQQRSGAFQLSLKERKATDISAPRVMTISGQTGTIQIGSIVTGKKAATGIRLEITPHLLPESKVIRMQHSFSIGEFANEMPQPFESLVGSGQTLLLLIDDPEDHEKPHTVTSQYLLMMTPEHIPQVEVEEAVSGATPQNSADAVDDTPRGHE